LLVPILLTAIAPGLALAFIIYLIDRFDREPLGLLIKLFLGGCLSVIPVLIVEAILDAINPFAGLVAVAFEAFLVAGLTEEFFKRRVVLKLAYAKSSFNEKLDGIVYAVFAALGFATIENILYLFQFIADNPSIGITRGVFAVPTHMLLGMTMGYYISLARFAQHETERRQYLSKSLYVPMLLHGIFDFILMSELNIAFVFFLPYVAYLWLTNLRKLNRYYQESKNRLFPEG
jgi:RsiW-degrading membrane proteinase PrsW (M82 family)